MVNMAVIANTLVYCDLIAPQFIGAAMVRYLRTFRIVPIDHDSEYLFAKLYYVPVEKRTFRDIRIEILNLSGSGSPLEIARPPLRRCFIFGDSSHIDIQI